MEVRTNANNQEAKECLYNFACLYVEASPEGRREAIKELKRLAKLRGGKLQEVYTELVPTLIATFGEGK